MWYRIARLVLSNGSLDKKVSPPIQDKIKAIRLFEKNIEATRQAFDMDGVIYVKLVLAQSETPEDGPSWAVLSMVEKTKI